ncbi:MAG TPA: hypothetical protein VG838_11825 [Opitutaceae bacterium]|nr:hypothetical protein [Opitutaceae bacterium]
MKTFSKLLPWLALPLAVPGLLAREETLQPFPDHTLTVSVPDKYAYTAGRDERGLLTVKIIDPNLKTQLLVSFFPDPAARLAGEDGQRAFVANTSQTFAEASVEKSYDFKDLSPRTGSGMFCVFTDASLVHKAPFAPGEFLKVSTGVKVWPGCFLLFTLLSNDTTSDEYQAEMKLLRESFVEKPAAGPASI